MEDHFDCLGSDLTELILSYLPIESIARSAAVCKLWHSIITTSSTFAAAVSSHKKKPWFFLYGHNNVLLKSNQGFAFDPDSFRWLRITSPPLSCNAAFFAGSHSFLFAAASSFSYSPILNGKNRHWRQIAPLHVSRCHPLVGVYNETTSLKSNIGKTAPSKGMCGRIIVVGGVRYVGGLVDIDESLAVEIYHPTTNSWEICPSLPADFGLRGNSSQWLSSAIFRNKFYVLGTCSSFMSAFHLRNRSWSEVRTLRPAGVRFSFLIGCEDMLVLAGMRFTSSMASFYLWSVNEETMGYEEIGRMPEDLLAELFECGEAGREDYDNDKFAALRCVGSGNLVFVFNEEHYKRFPACVCEITRTGGSNGGGQSKDAVYKSRWRRLPLLPSPVNQFHKVISFCSTISLNDLFA